MHHPVGSNGRGPAPAAAGRPTCDRVYDRIIDEFLKARVLERDEAFASGVSRRFREAPARLCCRSIGEWIDRKLVAAGWTQQDLADRVGVDRSAVARWTAGGAIALGHLVLVLIEFGSDLADLPVPARRELALEGYLAALSHIRSALEPQAAAGPLDREGFWCLYHLLSEPHWEKAIRARDRERLKAEAKRIFQEAGKSLGREVRRVVGVEGLRRLVEDWAAAWVVCLHLLPGGWAIR
jgi:transcriptional regulator with XRE-family HTH domain